MKSTSFGLYLELPKRTAEPLQLAIGNPKPELEAGGWQFIDPFRVTRTPWTYQSYIRGSKAEFSVAKHGYVEANSGWFSERSAGYLASGRPVVTQDTGFSSWLEAEEGVLAFTT